MKIFKKNYALAATFLLWAGPTFAAGLDDLSNANPENKANEDASDTPDDGDTEVPKDAVAAPALDAEKSESAKRPLPDRFYFATSFGWVSAALEKGTWVSSGMGDFTMGYQVTNIGFDIFGTYRFAPAAIAGSADSQAYRGVIEVHNFGALGIWKLSDSLKFLASAELGIATIALDSADNLPVDKDLEKTGAILNLGAGTDWKIGEKFDFGPRLHLGGGSATMMQLSANATMYF